MIHLLLAASTALAVQDTASQPQGVEYRIEATLDEATDILHGRAGLRYHNRSEVRIDTLWFHQHLNAFRPNSAWARRELEYGERRFQNLGPDEHAFERLRMVVVAGEEVRPVYPGAPDSTVVAIPLPTPLEPGAMVAVMLEWDARLSTLPRRQGRRGRHYDFAQWYPRIAVFEKGRWQTQPLLPQGEFYGEFGTYDVTLEVAEDQVVAATGVPVEGDPGWSRVAAPGTGEIDYQRAFYTVEPAEEMHLLHEAPAAGRRRIRWYAEDVHHFAWSADPEFRYEKGRVPRGGAGEAIPVHVLYQPGDTAWDEGVVVRRSETALAWLQELFGPYPWPQVTNLHRIESGGTEFPMLVMNGSPSEGLIVHEFTHQYLHGILANNEFRDGWLDEGFTSFVDNWYAEEQRGMDLWAETAESIRRLERAGRTQPIATPGAEFADPGVYSAMTYTKASLVFYMLRELVGEQTMREVLRRLYRDHALSHLDETDLRRTVREVTGEDYDWFFDQWLHTTAQLDYGVGAVRSDRMADGRWRTRVEVVRMGDAWMPVTLQVDGERRTLTSRERTQTVEVVTPRRPGTVVLDPEGALLDIDPSNNRRPI